MPPADAASGLKLLWSADLEYALQQVVHNTPGQVPATELGVLLAPLYGPKPSVYGMMFDTLQLPPNDPPYPGNNRIPREGCAVFLRSILNALTGGRPLNGNEEVTAYQAQVAFTMVHEIGHLFNLQHVQPGQPNYQECFLNTSSSNQLPQPLQYRFTPHECAMLANCNSQNPYVAPGGTDFGSTGIWDEPSEPRKARQVPARELRLTISTTPSSFWPWEPVELDLLLQRGIGARAARWQVLDQIDPGYRAFQLWITEPNGERRLFRSPRDYCAFEQLLDFRHGTPFRRDVSIFIDAGGYTFQRAGIHQLQVRMWLADGWYIESNLLPVEIRSRARLFRKQQNACSELSRLLATTIRSLYYRRLQPGRAEREALHVLATKYRGDHISGAALSVLGRNYALNALHRPASRAYWTKLAKPLLQRVVHHERIGENRRKNAQRALDELQDATVQRKNRANPSAQF